MRHSEVHFSSVLHQVEPKLKDISVWKTSNVSKYFGTHIYILPLICTWSIWCFFMRGVLNTKYVQVIRHCFDRLTCSLFDRTGTPITVQCHYDSPVILKKDMYLKCTDYKHGLCIKL